MTKIDSEGKPQHEMYSIGCTFGNARKYAIGLQSKEGKELSLNSNMGIESRKGYIWLGNIGEGKAIAELSRPAKFSEILGADAPADDYVVEIAPNVDMALIVSMVIAY